MNLLRAAVAYALVAVAAPFWHIGRALYKLANRIDGSPDPALIPRHSATPPDTAEQDEQS